MLLEQCAWTNHSSAKLLKQQQQQQTLNWALLSISFLLFLLLPEHKNSLGREEVSWNKAVAMEIATRAIPKTCYRNCSDYR
eukprot:1927029-Amphidinium_carterae.1